MEKKKAADQTPNNDKKQALDTAIRQIEKNFGKGAVMRTVACNERICVNL